MKKIQNLSAQALEINYKPYYQYLFAAAYLIAGNERLAEAALIRAMLLVPYPEESGGKEALSAAAEAAIELSRDAEKGCFVFSGALSALEDAPTALEGWLLRQEDQVIRAVALKFGLHLKTREIAAVIGESAETVNSCLGRAVRASKKSAENEKQAHVALRRAAERLVENACYPPDYGAVLRALQRTLESGGGKGSMAKPVVNLVSWIFALLMLMCVLLIAWLAAVLLDYFRGDFAQQGALTKEAYSLQQTEECQCPLWTDL